ncbi:MAG: hypothetical protein RIS92_3021 [Verrucomicrobiota bacterium]
MVARGGVSARPFGLALGGEREDDRHEAADGQKRDHASGHEGFAFEECGEEAP